MLYFTETESHSTSGFSPLIIALYNFNLFDRLGEVCGADRPCVSGAGMSSMQSDLKVEWSAPATY